MHCNGWHRLSFSPRGRAACWVPARALTRLAGMTIDFESGAGRLIERAAETTGEIVFRVK